MLVGQQNGSQKLVAGSSDFSKFKRKFSTEIMPTGSFMGLCHLWEGTKLMHAVSMFCRMLNQAFKVTALKL